MKGLLFKLMAAGTMLVGLPFLGVWWAGYPLARYFEFPPVSRYVHHAPFSWIVFIAYTIFILAFVVPFLLRGLAVKGRTAVAAIDAAFPWWGWLGAATGVAAWILAWTRFDWFAAFQPHTFTPLWLGYILVVNALTFKRTGRSLLTHRRGYFLALFPCSAIFWWFFEYLNRFVQNWSYQGPHFDAWEYFLFATLPFSTVLPAVLSTRDLIFSSHWLQNGFRRFLSLNCRRPRLLAGGGLIMAGIGLTGIGVRPDLFFALLWIAPFLIIVSLQALLQERHLFSPLVVGDWRNVIASALAALICGFFWEMWNYYSLARWIYSIPYVQRFPIFEMPLLGYAGYLPFGLECALIGDLIQRHMAQQPAI